MWNGFSWYCYFEDFVVLRVDYLRLFYSNVMVNRIIIVFLFFFYFYKWWVFYKFLIMVI